MLSIVIPTLNEEKHLPLLLDSIKKQDFKDYEIIVADAGSTDKTVEIAKSYGCKIVPGGLPAKGRNEGAKVAEGDLILFLDADTLLPENFLSLILNEFERKKLDLSTCLVRPFSKKRFPQLYYHLFINLPSLIWAKIYPQGTGLILVKKDLHQKIKGFNEELKIGEDHEYLRRAAKFGKYGVLRSAKIFYSERRFIKEGWFKLAFKFFLVHLHVIFLGPVKSDIFKYKFNHKNESES